MLGCEQHRALALGACAVVGIVEQAEGRFGPEHAAHGFVDHGYGDTPGPDQSREIVHVDPADHIHIHASLERELARIGARPRDAVVAELFDGRPVAHHEAVEAPLAAQHRGHEPGARGARDAADLVEGGHDGSRTGLHRAAVRWQVHLAQRPLGQVHGVVVPAALGAAVGGEVLDRREHCVGGARVGTLKAADSRCGHRRSQVGILA